MTPRWRTCKKVTSSKKVDENTTKCGIQVKTDLQCSSFEEVKLDFQTIIIVNNEHEN